MDVLHHHLEAVEASGFGNLDFGHEPLGKVFEDDTIGGSKEGQYILNEVLLVVVKFLPVEDVNSKVDLVYGPEAGHLILVHFPDVGVLDGQDNEPVRVIFEKRLRKSSLSLRVAALRVLGLR